MILSNIIREKFQEYWPSLFFMIITDKVYNYPTMVEFRDFLNEYRKTIPEYVDQLYECEEFALNMLAFQRRYQVDLYKKGKSENINWAFGLVGGSNFKTQKDMHFCNVCIVKDKGLVLVEPQIKTNIEWWIPYEDKVSFLFM